MQDNALVMSSSPSATCLRCFWSRKNNFLLGLFNIFSMQSLTVVNSLHFLNMNTWLCRPNRKTYSMRPKLYRSGSRPPSAILIFSSSSFTRSSTFFASMRRSWTPYVSLACCALRWDLSLTTTIVNRSTMTLVINLAGVPDKRSSTYLRTSTIITRASIATSLRMLPLCTLS